MTDIVGDGRFGPLRQALSRFAHNEAGTMLLAFTIATIALRLAGNVVLTRLLDPHAFGVMGVIASVTMVLAMISDFGFTAFVIRHERGDDPHVLDTIWTVRLGQAALQSIVMFAIAVPTAVILEKPQMTMPVMLCAPLLFLGALCPMSLIHAQRAGLVRKTCAIELGALAIQVGLNVALAFVIRDYRALIAGLYIGAIARIVLTMIILPGRSRLAWDRPLIRQMLAFSKVVMPSTILTLIITQSDKILFAKLFSLYNFGVYLLAANLALSLQPFGRNYVSRYFYPLISRTWRDSPGDMAMMFYAIRRRIYPTMFAVFGLGAGLAPIVIALLFDPRYEWGWIFLTIMLLRTALDLDTFASSQTLMAMGHPAATLHANILRILLFAAALVPGYYLLGALSLPLAQLIAELGTMIYLSRLVALRGIFRLRPHLAYYAVMLVLLALGMVLSMIAIPGLSLAVVEKIR